MENCKVDRYVLFDLRFGLYLSPWILIGPLGFDGVGGGGANAGGEVRRRQLAGSPPANRELVILVTKQLGFWPRRKRGSRQMRFGGSVRLWWASQGAGLGWKQRRGRKERCF